MSQLRKIILHEINNQQAIDQILDKINASGMESLTATEKNLLAGKELPKIEPGHVFKTKIAGIDIRFIYQKTDDRELGGSEGIEKLTIYYGVLDFENTASVSVEIRYHDGLFKNYFFTSLDVFDLGDTWGDIEQNKLDNFIKKVGDRLQEG